MTQHFKDSDIEIDERKSLLSPTELETEAEEKNSEFPESIKFIIGNEFCERFSFYGMKTILPLYLVGSLKFNENRATTIIHSFNFSAYFFTLFGGIVSDSVWGKYRTIKYLSLIYCGGMALLGVSSFPTINDNSTWWMFFTGLGLVAFGTGGIKPCVSAFGGDQFDTSQVSLLATYFSTFYFSINAGSVLSMFITPILRQNVHCFGKNNCYPLAFGLPAGLMFVATMIFILGSKLYVKRAPDSGNTSTIQVIKVLKLAFVSRFKAAFFKRHNSSTNDHQSSTNLNSWIDYIPSEESRQYSRKFLEEVRAVLKIISVFAPISLFWALYDQQGSRWTYQAILMNCKLGPISIKPEQMGVFNAILILVLIPCFDRIFYPALAKMNINHKPLARIFWGMLLAATSFLMAGILQFFIVQRSTFVDTPGAFNSSKICVEGCVHVLWQVPQYFLLTCGEVMVSITGLEFAYSQAPEGMKAVCSAAWLLTVAAGNLIVIVFNEMDPVGWFNFTANNPMMWNFFLWAWLLGIGILFFASLTAQFQYTNLEELHVVEEEEEEEIEF